MTAPVESSAGAPVDVEPRASLAARVLLVFVHAYRRWVSPLLPPRCRFHPTCSAYAVEALRMHGAAHGSWLAVRRISRCHPFNPGGVDLVPPARPRRPRTSGAPRC